MHMIWVIPVFKQTEQKQKTKKDRKKRKGKKHKNKQKLNAMFLINLNKGFDIEIGNTQKKLFRLTLKII